MITSLTKLKTPCLLLSQDKMRANQKRMEAIVKSRSTSIRTHLKTIKSIDAARYIFGGTTQPIAISTLKEAEEFGRAGFKDILYAVAITPQKLDEVISLRREGIDLKVLIDSEEMADAISQKSQETGSPIPTFIEIDVDGHRAGIPVDDKERLIDIAKRLNRHARLEGVLAHAGESYDLNEKEAIRNSALNEANCAAEMAKALQDVGIECPHVSIGSTPTALTDINASGITELRAGVYLFFDLVQTGIGVCKVDDIAVSVLTTVNGWHAGKRQIFIDAGWMALSRDRGTAGQKIDQYFGLVCDEEGNILPDLVVLATNQEHGIITMRPGSQKETPRIPIGTRLRILPNHACATASQHNSYHVLDADNKITVIWERMRGW